MRGPCLGERKPAVDRDAQLSLRDVLHVALHTTDGQRLTLFHGFGSGPLEVCDDSQYQNRWRCHDYEDPANAAFHVDHGFGMDGEGGVDVATFFATNDPRFDLSVDGVPLAPEEVFSTDVSRDGEIAWVYAFGDGLVGSHTFVGEWYEMGVLTLRKEVTVVFT